MPRMRDLTGQKFGRLTALEPVGRSKDGKCVWRCACDCGNTKDVQSGNLTRGASSSCGCLQKELTSKRSKTHGLRAHPLYMVHHMMKARCYKKTNKDYKHYGGRGIVMCDAWRESFEAFYEWANKSGYQPGLTVDRLDNDGPYSPDNCRFIGQAEQKRKRRNNIVLEFNGKRQCLAEWARDVGIPYSCLFDRIKRGWPTEKALTTPSRVCRS